MDDYMNFMQQLQNQGRGMSFGTGLGSALGGLYGLFGGGGKNPADTANQYLNQIPGQSAPYYKPYQDAGAGALKSLQDQYPDLLSGGVQNKLGESYKESPGYKFAMQQAMNAAGNAASSGGMLGTPMNQQQSMEMAQGVASKDYDNYMKNQIGLYGEGLHGQQGLNEQGYNANMGMADLLNNIKAMQAQYGYAGQAGQNQAKSGAMGNIFSGLGTIGGALLGGPMGGAGGNFLSRLFGGG